MDKARGGDGIPVELCNYFGYIFRSTIAGAYGNSKFCFVFQATVLVSVQFSSTKFSVLYNHHHYHLLNFYLLKLQVCVH